MKYFPLKITLPSDRSFELESINFHQGVIYIKLINNSGYFINLTFKVPIAFRFFDESDNYFEIAEIVEQYRGINSSETLVYKSKHSKYLNEFNNTSFDKYGEGLSCYYILSCNNCMEVLSFEDPNINMKLEDVEVLETS